MLQSLYNPRIVIRVSRIIPIIDQGIEHGTTFPPIIRIWQVSWCVSRSVSRVITCETCGNGLGGAFDRGIVGYGEIDGGRELGGCERGRGRAVKEAHRVWFSFRAVFIKRTLKGRSGNVGEYSNFTE